MSDNEVNMWQASSGLPLEGQRVRTHSALFTYDQEYSADAVVLKITMQPWDGAEDEGEPKVQMYSVGKNWEPADEGASVTTKDGKPRQFNDMTVIWKFLQSYMAARGNGDIDAGMKALINEGADPRNADIYNGLDVTMKGISYKDLSGKDRTTFGIGEYHGKVGEPAKPAAKLAAKPAAKAAAKPAAKAAPASEADSGGEDAWKEHLGTKLFIQLKKLAKEAENHDGFMEAAFDLDGVSSDDKAWNKVTEQIILSYEDDSLFAYARS